MKLEALPWIILFLPLLSAAVITLFTLRSRTVSSLISIGAIVAGVTAATPLRCGQPRVSFSRRSVHVTSGAVSKNSGQPPRSLSEQR